MARYSKVSISVFGLLATLVAGGCDGGAATPAKATGAAQTVSVAGTVVLPAGSATKAADLVLQTNTHTAAISTSGHFATQGAAADSSASTLAILTTQSGNAVFLKQVLADGSNSASAMDAKSTAAALVLYDPVFLRRSAADQALARDNLLLHAQFGELVTLVENAVVSDPVAPLDAATHHDIYVLAVTITKDLLAKFPTTKLSKLTSNPAGSAEANPFVRIEDDTERSAPTVFLVNNTYAYYDVTINKLGTPPTAVNPPVYSSAPGSIPWRVNRKSLISVAFDWPPISLNEAVRTEASLGDGDFSFSFSKQSGLSVFDGVMTLASTIIGVKGDSIETLDVGYKLIIQTGESIKTLIDKLVLQKPNTWDEANGLIYDTIVTDNGLGIILDYAKTYFAAKIKAALNDSWFTAIVKLVVSKAVVLGPGAYGTAEIAAIVISVAQAPDTYTETGTQTKGKYPATTITALKPDQGDVDAVVTITGSGFGTIPGLVKFNSTLAVINSWTDKQITVKVPAGATTGSVVVYAGSVASNNVLFTVAHTEVVESVNIQWWKTEGAVTATLDGKVVGTASVTNVNSYGSPVTLAKGAHTLQFDAVTSGGGVAYVWSLYPEYDPRVSISPTPHSDGSEGGSKTYTLTVK